MNDHPVAIAVLSVCIYLFCPSAALGDGPTYGFVEPQIAISRVDQMPNVPSPLKIRDWHKTAVDFADLAFNPKASGQYLPLIWFDPPDAAVGTRTFGLPSYVGARHQKHSQEGVCCLSAVLSALLVGAFTPQGSREYAAMCIPFYSRINGTDAIVNNINSTGSGSFWYDLWPSILFDGVSSSCPDEPGVAAAMRNNADTWSKVTDILDVDSSYPNFNHTSFNLVTMTPIDNGKWIEPDGASGVSCLEYLAYARWGDPKYLRSADLCQKFLSLHTLSPLYEVLESYGAYTAARMNAEQQRNYDVEDQVKWAFEPGPTRPGWGLILQTWNGVDCSGLIGSTVDAGGYGFTMNTFAAAGSLAPLTRYDQRFARVVGKWLLHAANAVGNCYSDALPAQNQSCPFWIADPNRCVAYEGIRKHPEGSPNGISPFAGGDPTVYDWGPPTDFGVYGAAHVGFFGGIISTTDQPGILQINCLKTDFFHSAAYPTFLYYNPYNQSKNVKVFIGRSDRAVYSLTRHLFLSNKSRGSYALTLASDTADVLVLASVNGRLHITKNKLYDNGTVIDYRAGQMQQSRR